ncbi:YT521-B-like family protein [Metarhizium acridum CQMa 102]|uniref:YT521-B-like family protein n=1 Tax=Metarhizium acridum (strain CQMa 102) TaxID=655827 RepID=E9E0K3_METAQ|nr:YT521-B-like family protein [Metarhizium acridum CQMa 102]EFY90623.1 YT521-B-like family protein [Metarhizium acridum CQMa 102]
MTEQNDVDELVPDPSNLTLNNSLGTQSDAAPQELPATVHHPVVLTATASTNPHTALQELVKVDEELRLWLDHTSFFDLAHRKRVLGGVRELQRLEAEKAKVLEMIQSSKPSGQPASEPSLSANSTLTRKELHSGEDAACGIVSPPREPAAYARSRPDAMVPMMGETEQLSGRLGPGKTDTRYFLVKSSNTTNVYMSRRDGLWITQAKNGPLFTQAFRECRSVVLFFSINKSKAFQGYAKMTSAPDHSIPHPPWIVSTTHDMHTTAPFRIDWINEAETPFSQVGDLKNPYNEYNPVFVGRDGQEYSEDCGRFMMGVMDRVKATQGSHAPGTPAGAHASRQKSKAEARRRYATAAGPASSGSQPRDVGLRASRWRPQAPSPVFLSLDPQPVHNGEEDLLLDYP